MKIKIKISREIDEQRWTESCVTLSVTGCTPQAFLSLAPVHGPVDDDDDDHEDDGRPCLKRRAIPSHHFWTPLLWWVFSPSRYFHHVTFPPHLFLLTVVSTFLAFASSFASVFESAPLTQFGSFLLAS